MKHPKYDLILAAISGEQMQILHNDFSWIDCTQNAALDAIVNTGFEVRIKPKTIRIGDTDVSAPVSELLEIDQKYWVWCSKDGEVYEYFWANDKHDRQWLRNRLIHLTEGAARKNMEAVIKALGGEV